MDLFEHNPDLSVSSKKLYQHNLKKLNGGNEIKNLNFLKKTDAITDYLSNLKPNTRRSYLIAIVSILKGRDKMKKVKDIYYNQMMELNAQLKDNTEKTQKEEDNWMSQEAVQERYDEVSKVVDEIGNKRKLQAGQYERLLDCLILGLFVLMPPRRNKDYTLMVVGYDDEDMSKNYYHQGKMFFNNYKTAKTYKQQTSDVPPELEKVIKLYLKFKPKDDAHFLINAKGKQINDSFELTRRFHKIFGKKVSSSMLRKIYLTDKYSDKAVELKEDSKAMGTSVSTINNNYIKKD